MDQQCVDIHNESFMLLLFESTTEGLYIYICDYFDLYIFIYYLLMLYYLTTVFSRIKKS